jgi:6-phosphogluconolactonase
MKFNWITRTTLAAGTSLAVGLGLAACSRDYTAAYVYAVSSATGSVSAFAVDYQTGVLTQLSGSPFSSQLTNPTSVVASPTNKTIYVIGGTQNAEVEQYSIGSDGKIYAGNTYNITGTYPTGATVDPTGRFLYVTYTYETHVYNGTSNDYGPGHPGPGGITIFPINSDGTLGTPLNTNVGNNPVGIAVSIPTCTATPLLPGTTTGQIACNVLNSGTTANNGYENVFAFVLDQEGSTFSPGASPTLVTLVQNPTSGALTLTPQTTLSSSLKTYQGINAGVLPSAVAVDPTGRFVYFTDAAQNEAFGFTINYTTTGALTTMNVSNNPVATGLYPVAITIEPRGKYLYIANYNSNTVSSFSIDPASGNLGGTASVGNFAVSTAPSCVTVDPALGIYLYTSNRLDNSISGGKLLPNTGQLNAVPNTPFPTFNQPSCLVAVSNGSHASSILEQ